MASLSPAQQRTWFLRQLFRDQPTGNPVLSIKITGHIDRARCQKALQVLVARYACLRLEVVLEQGSLQAGTLPTTDLNLLFTDVRGLPVGEVDDSLQSAVDNLRRPFDDRELRMRAHLLTLAAGRHSLLLATDRLAVDTESLWVLYNEWVDLVRQTDDSSSIPNGRKDYHEFYTTAPQPEFIPSISEEALGPAPALDFPADFPRPPLQSFRGAQTRFSLGAETSKVLYSFAAARHVRPEEVLFAAFQVLLHRWTGRTEIAVGWNHSGRTEHDHRAVGSFAYRLPVKLQFTEGVQFRDVLNVASARVRAAERLPRSVIESLLKQASSGFDLTHPPAFQAGFAAAPPPAKESRLASCVARPTEFPADYTDLDLQISFATGETEIVGTLTYNKDLFAPSTANRLLGNFRTLLGAALANDSEMITRLPLLTPAEEYQLLQHWNNTRCDYPSGKCIHQLFEQQVSRTPKAVALVYQDTEATYEELNQRANLLALYLQERGIGPESRVGVCMIRSVEMVIALYAVHKAGGAYVPMDPGYPPERIAFMLEDAACPVVLTQQEILHKLPDSSATPICVDALDLSGMHGSNVASSVTPENLAYLIYTSGSTGKPKGVMVRHRNAVNFFTGMDNTIGNAPGVWLALTSISFDISVLELFWTLTRGFKVVVQEDKQPSAKRPTIARSYTAPAKDFSIASQIRRHGVTHLQCTPSLANMMLQDPETAEAIRTVGSLLFGGEALPPGLVKALKGAGNIFNLYGPTETTVWSTVHPVTRNEDRISIGRPIANTTIYILDHHLQPVPVGVAGELFIGGDGVTRGYLNRQELTNERFLADPFAGNPDARMYRTGDLARFLDGGTIEYLGRLDFQVKLRGFRIELGEIEAAIRQHPNVRESAVALWDAGVDDQRLVGYFVARNEPKPEAQELRRLLKGILPDYMVPSVFVGLDALPLTPNGKTDRKALPLPRHEIEEAPNEPLAPLQQEVIDIWQDLLQIEGIGLQDNFGELGGTLPLAFELWAQLKSRFRINLEPIAVFRHPTPAGLAQHIEELNPALQFSRDQPRDSQPSALSGAWTLFALSGHSAPELESRTRELGLALRKQPAAALGIANRSHSGPTAQRLRRIILGKDHEQALTALELLDPESVLSGEKPETPPRLAFLFGDSSAAEAHRYRELYRAEPLLRNLTQAILRQVPREFELEIQQLLHTTDSAMGSAATSAKAIDLCCLVSALSLARLHRKLGISPWALIGRGLGEIAVACTAGVCSTSEAFQLAVARNQVVSQLLDLPLECCTHEQRQHLFAPIRNVAGRMRLRPPRLRCLSTIRGDWASGSDFVSPDYWVAQVSQSARTADALTKLLVEPATLCLEITADESMRLVHSRIPRHDHGLIRTDAKEPVRGLYEAIGKLWLAGINVRWEAATAPLIPDDEPELAQQRSEEIPMQNNPPPRVLEQHHQEGELLPMTEAQKEIWFACQMSDAVSCAFNQSSQVHLKGSLDLEKLNASLEWLTQRHEALRLVFSPDGETQWIKAEMPIHLPLVDLSGLSQIEQLERLDGILSASVNEPFDLEKGPLWRAQLTRISGEYHVIVITAHHLGCDGGSLNLLLQELGTHYGGSTAGNTPTTPLQAVSFSKFAREQERLFKSDSRIKAEAFWLEQFGRPVPPLELPTDRPRPSRRSFTGGSASTLLSNELTQGLKRLSGKHRSTLATTLLAAYYLLLHRLTGQAELVVGLPMSSRSVDANQALVGHCVNFLPLRLAIDPDASFADHLSAVRRLLLDAHEHQTFTLGTLLKKLNFPRHAGRLPLVSVMFNLDRVRDEMRFGDLDTRIIPNPHCHCHFDLSFSLADVQGRLQLHCHYSSELFDSRTIERWFELYKALLGGIIFDPKQRISALVGLIASGPALANTPQEQPAPQENTRAVDRGIQAPTHTDGQLINAPRSEVSQGDNGRNIPPNLSEIEQQLAAIWQEVIGVGKVTREDNFFDLGGHSVLLMQVINRVRKAFSAVLTLRQLFEAPTIAELAPVILQQQSAGNRAGSATQQISVVA